MSYGYRYSYRSGKAGAGGGEPTITSSDGEAASLTNNGDGTYGVVVGGATVGTITQAQINAGGWITVVAPVTGMSGNNVVLNTVGHVIYVGDVSIETDVEVRADSVVVGNALPFDASAFSTATLEVRFSYSVGADTLNILTTARSFTPATLFASGEQGFWFDPSDLSTMFQDSAGATPVTAVGQPVGRILDKSGRGNHATQATLGARPTLQEDGNGNRYLQFDGSDDFLQFASRLWAGGAATLVAAVQGAAQGDRRIYGERNTGNSSPIYSLAQTSNSFSDALSSFIRFDNNSNPVNGNSSSTVISGVFNNTARVISTLDSGSSINMRSNRGTPNSNNYTRSTLTVNVATLGALLSASPSSFFAGRVYGIVGRAATSTEAQRANTENWLAARCGVTLP